MAQAIHARLDAALEVERRSAKDETRARAPEGVFEDIRFTVHEDLAALATEWRAFEREADGTVFQTYEWLSCWQRHVGMRQGARPAVVLGRDAQGLLFLLPLAVRPAGFVRALEWLGSDLCDYNGPLLAPRFAERVDRARFLALWGKIAQCLQGCARLRHDIVRLTKMPERVGAQPNPLLALGVTVNPSGAYLTQLAGDLGRILYRQALLGDAPARPHQAQAARRFGRGASRHPAERGGDRADARSLDGAEGALLRAHGRRQSVRLSGPCRILSRARQRCGKPPLAHVSRLDVGATAAAINLGLVHRGRYYHLLASYDDGEVSRFGPGVAHLHDLMQYAIAQGCGLFDFTIGDEGYKRDWSDTELALYDHIAAVTLRGALVALPLTAARRLKRWIKQTPLLWNAGQPGARLLGRGAALTAKEC